MHMDHKGLKIVRYEKRYYEEISKFYTGHGWKVAPKENILPSIGFVVINDEGLKLAVGFLYESNSPIYFLEWTATNPLAPLRARAKALRLLIKTVQGLVKKTRSDAQVMQYTPNEAIIRFYKKLGFVPTETATLLHWGA